MVPWIKVLQMALSFLFLYSCVHLQTCSLWISFGAYVTGILFETASFVSFMLISHGYCIMCERLSIREKANHVRSGVPVVPKPHQLQGCSPLFHNKYLKAGKPLELHQKCPLHTSGNQGIPSVRFTQDEATSMGDGKQSYEGWTGTRTSTLEHSCRIDGDHACSRYSRSVRLFKRRYPPGDRAPVQYNRSCWTNGACV